MTIKILISLLFGMLLAIGCSACGLNIGPITLGTESYLAEVNRGKQMLAELNYELHNHEQLTDNDREELEAVINKK